MSKVHNKRRNVGLIYELLLRQVAHGTVDGVSQDVEAALAVLRRHFKPGTELFREFRLFHALSKVQASSERLADRILAEAKIEAQKADVLQLDKDKTSLLHSLNSSIKDPATFFSRRVPDFRTLATAQRLLNAWRSTNSDPVTVAQLEEGARVWLLQPKGEDKLDEVLSAPKPDPLALKILREKIEARLKRDLSQEQANILREHLLGSDPEDVRKILIGIKAEALAGLDAYLLTETNQIVREKSASVRRKIQELDLVNGPITDQLVSRVLHLSALRQEMLPS